ncbi:MAG: type II toxin-antitoxin system Phd/YefM family antitoxin [Clostridia bacterium]|nr:type II toxin-antitoxin system Phd/YefM family antitoxin [Clostridia bacterium]
MIIKASASLRNKYGEISKLAHKTNEPIFITKNGEGDLVLMSIEKYERLMSEIKLIPHLVRSEIDIENGNYITYEDFKKELNEEYEDKVAEDDEKYEV